MRSIKWLFFAILMPLPFIMAGCESREIFGEAYIICLNSDSDSEEIKEIIIEESQTRNFLIYDRSNDARSSAERLGANLRHAVSVDVFLGVDTRDNRGIITLDNITLNAGELGLTLFPGNLPHPHKDYYDRVLSIVSSHGEIFKLERGGTKNAGICNEFQSP